MKRSISKFSYLAGIFILVGLFSCEGPPGPAGANGTNGTDGTNGTNGTNGTDGNANVTIVSLLKSSFTWTAGSYLGRTANTYSFTANAVSQDIIDHGTVLGFCYLGGSWWALPFVWENNTGTSTQYVLHSYALNTISLYAYETAGVLEAGGISEYRFLIITDNTIAKSASSERDILDKLEIAGVDVNDYYEVMDYFGLEY